MASSPCLRRRISSPLEAGHSVADGHQLPTNVSDALEYASKRLGRKAAHITLLVVRRDYQLPTAPWSAPAQGPASPPASVSSRIDALKQLLRPTNSGEDQIRERILHVHLDHFRNGTLSPAFSEASTTSTVSSVATTDSTFSHRRWPGSPAIYGSVPVTPATPFTTVCSLSGASEMGRGTVSGAGQFGIKLVYAHPLGPREEKTLSQTLDKAAKKFKLDPIWLPQPVSPSTLGLPVDLVWNSTTQNEALFSSEHLTVLSLDRLYTLRTALQAYATTQTLSRLEDAVDELRRVFLANGRRPLRKSALLAAYRWLSPVSDAALADVCHMYERAYGGVERDSGVEDDIGPIAAWPLAERSQGDGEPTARMEMAIPDRRNGHCQQKPPYRRPETPPRLETPAPDHESRDLDKEILLSACEPNLDDHSDLDAVETWYRRVHVGQIDPLRSHPALVEIMPPSPSPTPPPPPPKSPPYAPRQQRPVDNEIHVTLRVASTSPKLQPAPPGRALALKLQTTFDRAQTAKQQDPNTQAQGTAEEEEEDLTARPTSAIKTGPDPHIVPLSVSFPFPSANPTPAEIHNQSQGKPSHWSRTRISGGKGGSNGGTSIDGMLLHGCGQQQGHEEAETEADERVERVGPMTPNGYDDISPVTRGEWGFLMGEGLIGRVARVETC